MRRTIVAVIAVIVVIALACLGLWHLQSPSKPYEGTPESIVIGVPPLVDTAGLIYIADDQHFFSDNGLNVTLKEYDTGFKAVRGTLNGENDISIATEFVAVEYVFQKEDILGVGSVSRSESHEIIGRKDRGIQNALDLRGKNIGVVRGTASEFYLGRFLELHGIDRSDLTINYIEPGQFVNTICNGTVDAIVVWGDFVNDIKERLGSNAVVWSAQSGQMTYWTAIGRNNWVKQHPELVSRFLKSLDQAAKYAYQHPTEAKDIVKKYLEADDAYIASVWSNTVFALSLDQSLIIAMEDEGRWMIKNNLTTQRNVPDYYDYLYLKGLEEVNPGAVSIIG